MQVKLRFDVTQYCPIGFDNLAEFHFDKKIKRVNMLFDQPFHFQERWKKIPFVLFPFNPRDEHQAAQRLPLQYRSVGLAISLGKTAPGAHRIPSCVSSA
jgi:hypothetical protein